MLDLNVIQVDKEPSPRPTHAEIIFTYALHENQNLSSYQQPQASYLGASFVLEMQEVWRKEMVTHTAIKLLFTKKICKARES